jgi:hypothetical protein
MKGLYRGMRGQPLPGCAQKHARKVFWTKTVVGNPAGEEADRSNAGEN